MRSVFTGTVEEGKDAEGNLKPRLALGGPYNRSRFTRYLSSLVGKKVRINITELVGEITDEQRGYFEGALVPAVCDWHEKLDPENPEDVEICREWLKQEFNCRFLEQPGGGFTKVGMSTTRLNSRSMSEFIERIVAWMMEQQIPVPDPELYKKWRDSAPPAGEEYADFLRRENLKVDGTPKE